MGPVEALTVALARRDIYIEILGLHQSSIGPGSADALTLIESRIGEETH